MPTVKMYEPIGCASNHAAWNSAIVKFWSIKISHFFIGQPILSLLCKFDVDLSIASIDVDVSDSFDCDMCFIFWDFSFCLASFSSFFFFFSLLIMFNKRLI